MRKSNRVRVHHEKKNGARVDHRDGVRVHHAKKSNRLRVE